MSARLAALKERADAEGKKAREIAQRIADEGRDMTDDEKADYDAAMKALVDILDSVKAVKADEAVLAQAKAFSDEVGVPEDGGDLKARVKSLGLTVVESPEFKAMMRPFTGGQIPSKARIQSDPIKVKSLFTGASSTSAGAFVVNDRTDIVEMLGRKPLTIRNLVANRRTSSDAVEFVRETSHTNAAAPVPEATSAAMPTAPAGEEGGELVLATGGGYKPEGSWAFEVVTTNVKTIAEWVPVTRRALADVAQLEGLINDELSKDIAEEEEDQILNGNGSGENLTGINSTSGVQTQAWTTDFFTTTRKAITKARTVGRVNPTAWVLNPEDAETLDLLKDGENRYYYGGPQYIGQRTLWGVPVVESESQAKGTGLLGDFNKAVLWDREETTVTMTDSHADFFIRNLIAILAEERVAFGVTRPTAFVKVAMASS
ncbi:major capsid protein [Mycobacterium phage Butters]|uniref:Major capsid protein n=1 Tax=Mycobacterium phage Butters TaxID=1296646 RepID=M4WNS1_9CAUD|nr:major head protein [Mycobacterium phage Butters]WAW19092.1 major capsid protein [Mycobacterium phage BIB10]WAW19154.1 major capsid protein [Mycobacterium phage BIB9]WAW19216.1 major capsid protein [Mycobacterium phage BIB8]WAW19278.1 major capsid protein [Mycobacterium phage BIB7]WAW19340.1 major capsid protein [Mycobacterium phage BIB6]WAW19402.1 major capsid protein [Mycobacterium phage BIB4]WAW19464.1 major capsid protein [Mycobacterium phage BIB3]WAW19526.1 major capsid protein [Myco